MAKAASIPAKSSLAIGLRKLVALAALSFGKAAFTFRLNVYRWGGVCSNLLTVVFQYSLRA